MNSAGLPTAYEHGNRLTAEGSTVDPILVEIVQGTLASVEMEVETAIARTTRSPMIRDAHDFRAGIHDRQLRKLTGRSYSALVHPIVRDFPLAEMREGDVFFHNDVYESEGGIGHLPDLCVTVPVFHEGEVVAFVQAFGHHDDIGGAVPGSMPSNARTVFEEGLSVPPIRLWDAGVPNEAALRIMTRNSRMPDSLAADLDAECSACLMGARRLAELFARYGRDTIETAFDAILDATTETYRREILGKIPDGTYVWEDYAEHDGVDEPQAAHPADHPDQGVDRGPGTRRRRAEARHRLHRHRPPGEGPDQPLWRLRRRQLPQEVARPDPAQPRRHPRADGRARRQRGRRAAHRDALPREGDAADPDLPGARPTPARSSSCGCSGCWRAWWRRRSTDGCPPTRRRSATPASTARTATATTTSCARCSAAAPVAATTPTARTRSTSCPDSRNLPTEFTESRFPFVVERLGLAVDSGGAGRHRGGLGYEKHIRMLRTRTSCRSPTARSSPAGASRAARRVGSFEVTVDLGGPDERVVDALADAEPVRAGQVIRIRTTGGGGWGDPLDRPYDEVDRDLRWGKVSFEGARRDYGVVATGSKDDPVIDTAASDALREELRGARPEHAPFFDRGPGYAALSGGAAAAEVDWV